LRKLRCAQGTPSNFLFLYIPPSHAETDNSFLLHNGHIPTTQHPPFYFTRSSIHLHSHSHSKSDSVSALDLWLLVFPGHWISLDPPKPHTKKRRKGAKKSNTQKHLTQNPIEFIFRTSGGHRGELISIMNTKTSPQSPDPNPQSPIPGVIPKSRGISPSLYAYFYLAPCFLHFFTFHFHTANAVGNRGRKLFRPRGKNHRKINANRRNN